MLQASDFNGWSPQDENHREVSQAIKVRSELLLSKSAELKDKSFLLKEKLKVLKEKSFKLTNLARWRF